jgi:hypothetical protein
LKLKNSENSMREELAKLEDLEKNTDKKSVEQLQELVAVNDSLKQKEQDYKKGCKVFLRSKKETNLIRLLLKLFKFQG